VALLRRLVVMLVAWFERAVPAEPGPPRWQEASLTLRGQGGFGAEERRRSTRAVTREQLGVAHWSCHTHL